MCGAMDKTLILVGALAMGASSLTGCKEDPPPPPTPAADTATAAASGPAGPKGSSAIPPHHRAARMNVPRISPATMKKYRVEACYFGSLGVTVAAEAYQTSLGGAEPSTAKIPSFGEYPETKKLPGQKKMAGRAPILAAGRQLPFVRHVRACSIAKSLKEPAHEELDAAVVAFEGYISGVNKALLDATRYYTRKQYEKDDFKRAKQIHTTLSESFPKLDEELKKFGDVVNKWALDNTKTEEKLDDAGQLAQTVLHDARALTLMFLEEERDKGKIGEAITALEQKRDELLTKHESDKQAPHPRVMGPKLLQFINAAKAAAEIDGKLEAEQRYPVTAHMANLVEANQRALAQLMRQRGDVGGSRVPIRALKPGLRPQINKKIRDGKKNMPKPGSEVIPLVDLAAVDREMGAAMRAAVDRVATSSQFVLGDEVAAFEQALAGYCGKKHGIGVGSGTDALVLALRASGVAPGDVVVTTPLSFIATAEAIIRVGATPRFVDVEPDTLCLCPEATKAQTDANAIVPVHLYGHACAPALCSGQTGLPVIHDAAHALGIDVAGTMCVSFHPSKLLGAWGDAGAVLTDDDDVAARVRSLRIHGRDSEGRYVELGLNSRLDAIQAAVLSVKLEHLPRHIARRRAIAAELRAQLADVEGVALMPELAAPFLFTVRIAHDRDGVQHRLRERGVASRVYYRRLLCDEPAIVGAEVVGSLAHARAATSEVVSLPLAGDVNRVVEALKSSLRS